MRLVALTAVLVGVAAAPVPKLTPGQADLMRRHDAIMGEAARLGKEKKNAAAWEAGLRAVTLLEEVDGPLTLRVAGRKAALAGGSAPAEQTRRADALRVEAIRALARLLGPRHHRTVDLEWEGRTARLVEVMDAAGRKRLAEGQRMNAEALALSRRGDHAAALPMSRRSVDAARELLGERHPSYATALDNLATLLQSMGDHAAALPLHRQALAIRKEALGEGHPSYALGLNNLALLHKTMGDHAAALPLYKEALAVRKAALGGRHPDYAQSLDNLAMLLKAMGDLKGALPPCRRALEIRKETLGERHPTYALSLNNLAMLLAGLGDLKGALPLMERSVSVLRATLGKNHPGHATGLNNLATLLMDMGELKAALLPCRQALAIRKAALGVRHPDYAQSLNNLGLLLQEAGDLRAALPLLREALAVHKAALGEKHPSYAAGLNNLAFLLEAMGDRKAALPLMEQAAAAHKAALGEKHPGYAAGLNNLAFLLMVMGDLKGALPLMEQAAAVYKEALGERHPSYAACLGNMAGLLQSMGDPKAALPLRRRALAIEKAALGERHPHHARGLNNLAMLLKATGDHTMALPLLRQALAIRKEALGERHPDHAVSLSNLAMLLREAGDLEGALEHMERALAVATDQLRDLAAVQSDRQQLAAAHAARHFLHNRLLLPDSGKHPAAAAHVLAWKGQVLLRQQQRRLFLRLSGDAEAGAAAERLGSVTRQLVALRQSPDATRERLAALEQEQDEAQARLSKLSTAYREARETERKPEALAKTLPDGAVLVDYLFHHEGLAAFVHRPGKAAARFDLGKADAVVAAVRGWRADLVRGRQATASGTKVKRLLLDPLAKHLDGAKTLLVSPDGVLGTAPFAALPGGKAGTFLIEDVAVAVVPAPAQVPDLMKPRDRKERLGPTLLVLGDLRYDPSAGARPAPAAEDERSAARTGRERFTPLAATRAEAQAVKASFSELFRGGTVTDLRGGEATKKAVREHLPKVRYAHFATHGFFAPETARAAEARGRPDGRREVVGWHPLLLSGLALSDANREPQAGGEDGILTALEVSEMDLTRLELAVLSACETGLGQEAGGEGLLGMQRAFAAAGARTVVASLWKVDDRATGQIMQEFYAAAWDTGKIVSRAEALRHAQLSMLKEGRRRGVGKDAEKTPGGETRLPPFYWAGFVLSGDWR